MDVKGERTFVSALRESCSRPWSEKARMREDGIYFIIIIVVTIFFFFFFFCVKRWFLWRSDFMCAVFLPLSSRWHLQGGRYDGSWENSGTYLQKYEMCGFSLSFLLSVVVMELGTSCIASALGTIGIISEWSWFFGMGNAFGTNLTAVDDSTWRLDRMDCID